MVKIGCQTYTWQMVGDDYLGRLDHIIKIAGTAGFAGLEPEIRFLGALRDPGLMKAHLDAAGIELASLCIVEDWRDKTETDAERAEADWAIDFLASHFPKAVFNICPMPGADRSDLRERQDNQLACMNAIAARAADKGLVSAYHPNSPQGSVCRTDQDYDRMLNGVDSDVLQWIPDIGHIAKGGMDVLDILKTYRSLIAHVHFKDMTADGHWAMMGKGIIDFDAITDFLVSSDYNGWLVVEDESPVAERDPDGVVSSDAVYMDKLMAARTA